MRNFRRLSLWMVLCLLCTPIWVCLSEADVAVKAAEDCAAAPWLEEPTAELPGDYALPGPGEAEGPGEAAPADSLPNAGSSQVPLKDYNFPDASFRQYLETHCDTDGNGYLSDAEIGSVTSLDLHGLSIVDLKGIEFFPALSELLCNDNLLSSLDLRRNTALRLLNCSGNRLDSLDLSACAALLTLDCSGNRLSSMCFPETGSLYRLTCNDNALLTLDLGLFNPQALPIVVADVPRTITYGRPGSGGFTAIGTPDACLTCDDYIELTSGGNVLRSLTAKHIGFEATSLEVEVSQSKQIVPVFEPAEAAVPLYYVMDDALGAISVSADGTVTGVKPGSARVLVFTNKDFVWSGLAGELQVTVTPPGPTGIKFRYEKLDLGLGESIALETTVEPDDAVTNLTFQVADPSIATTFRTKDDKTYVMGKKIGKTTVTVTTANGKSDTCTVTVKPAPEKIRLAETGTVKLGLGNGLFLHVIVDPWESGSQLTWTSSNEEVATVRYGSVTAKAKGKTTITVKTFNGLKASVKIKVIDPEPETIELSRKNCKLNVGDTLQLKATIKPANAKNKKVTWSSSNKKVASVTKDGLVVARKKGAATITAKTSNGKKATCKVSVVIPEVTGVQIVHTKTTVKVKKTLKLKAVLAPAHAESKLTWSSSDTSIATVNKKGEVKGRKKGTVTITVKTENGKKDSIRITVI